MCEKRLGFSLDYYKYLDELNVIKLTTQDGLEYFGVNSLIDALSIFDPNVQNMKDRQHIRSYFEQKERNPRPVVDLYNSDYNENHNANYLVCVEKNPMEYQFIKDESLRRKCQEIGVGMFIPEFLIHHFVGWLSNRCYAKIQTLMDRYRARRIQKELNARDPNIDELKKAVDKLNHVVKSCQESVSQLENIIQDYERDIDTLSRITFLNSFC